MSILIFLGKKTRCVYILIINNTQAWEYFDSVGHTLISPNKIISVRESVEKKYLFFCQVA